MKQEILLGDCLELMKDIPDGSVDAIVTDPPYGLEFMGKDWDKGVPGIHFWQEMIRILKPGGHLLAFGGTRTYHRMAVAIEDAGFEIRDMIEWVYGSGFPKSLNIGKAVDKLQGNEREVGKLKFKGGTQLGVINDDNWKPKDVYEDKGTSEWEGWGTALKPAHEPICMARKPLNEKTVAENCLKWGTGGINIDESRVGTDELTPRNNNNTETLLKKGFEGEAKTINPSPLGRFPANLIHDNSEEVRECFPETNPSKKAARGGTNPNPMDWGNGRTDGDIAKGHDDDGGSASRFFKSIIYQAKASKNERGSGNVHPTVKPVALMEYLINMLTPKGGIVLDPFAGSGTTAIAALNTNRRFIVMEKEPDYYNVILERVSNHKVPKEKIVQLGLSL